MGTQDDDITTLGEAAFLAEYRRVREEVERTPAHAPGHGGLTARWELLDAEFMRRAQAAWASWQLEEGGQEMDNPALTELALRRARDHRDDMTRWLALEILMTDEVAQQDPVLQEHLIELQDKIEAKMRATT